MPIRISAIVPRTARMLLGSINFMAVRRVRHGDASSRSQLAPRPPEALEPMLGIGGQRAQGGAVAGERGRIVVLRGIGHDAPCLVGAAELGEAGGLAEARKVGRVDDGFERRKSARVVA